VASDANAQTMLGIEAQAANVAGRDAFGMEKGVYTGFDATSTVTYDVDEEGRGGFSIAFDNETRVGFTSVSDIAAAQLGFALPDGSENEVVTGKDVEGTINGVTANGRGQVLVAGSGSEAATNGYLLGSPGFDWSTAVALDASSNTFSLTIDGVTSGEISLDEGVYANGASLANEMTQKINADAELAGSMKQVEVQFDEQTNTFGIFSASTGEESKVRLNSINSTFSTITGLSTSSETVDGKAASGEPDPARGLQVRVLGGETGERGSVNYIQGVFDQLDGLFQNMLSSQGTITSRMDRLDLQMESIAEDRLKLDERISAQEARLKAQFSFNDRIISQLNTTESFLTQQFEIMNGMLANKN
ncbi:MAG: flagellar filament capping protein FliD, partial [Natronospirillum sp.]